MICVASANHSRACYVQLIAVIDEGSVTQWRAETRDWNYRLRSRMLFSAITDGGTELAKVKAMDALSIALDTALAETAALRSE